MLYHPGAYNSIPSSTVIKSHVFFLDSVVETCVRRDRGRRSPQTCLYPFLTWLDLSRLTIFIPFPFLCLYCPSSMVLLHVSTTIVLMESRIAIALHGLSVTGLPAFTAIPTMLYRWLMPPPRLAILAGILALVLEFFWAVPSSYSTLCGLNNRLVEQSAWFRVSAIPTTCRSLRWCTLPS